MIVFIFLAVRVSSENDSTSQTKDCAYLTQQCFGDAYGCAQLWRAMEDACSGPGDFCTIKNSSRCDLSIQSLVESDFHFQECLCINDLQCTVGKLLGKNCINKTEESALSSDLAPESNVTKQFYASLMAERKNDCVVAAQVCRQAQHCNLLHESFKQTCGKETAECSTLRGRLLCEALRERLRETVLWDCQCGSPSEADCIRIWKSLFEDICIQDAPINQISTFSKDYDDEFKEDIVSGFKGIKSCLEVTEACVGDMVCNAQLALYLKACSAKGNLCDVKHCQTAIRFFYQNMPFNIAQMLAFCDCAQSDILCQQSKEALHSKPCALNVVPPPTCLSVIHSCRRDESCRKHYLTFQSECWPRVTVQCHEDETCISMLGKQDLECSGSDNCRAAYLGTFGTVLQVQCTCQSTTQSEESLCKTFQHMLHRKSCFTFVSPFPMKVWIPNHIPLDYQVLSNVKGISLFRRKHAKEITVSGLNSSINGEVIYAIMCTAATCGIFFLVMLKLKISRTSSKKRDPSSTEMPGVIITY
ncbi:GDNF family receptor alpha-like isoform X2 [Nannospalax galili]|uniref:GDNF family receptor alpha-like isoform X2 n=1 Tax=Nannospalax galili TaxID=1026970 RepID=UPI00081A21FC|nr:GDNF family receptor alpha-like isoform X2 [Nannospalax galili]